MTFGDVDELRVAARRPDRERMADDPEDKTRDPEAEAKADPGRERAIGDREGARRAAEQDRLGERAVHGKLDAAKAIDSPNTIWTMRRKPPDVSPNEMVSPVIMMMISEITFATGPSTLSRIDCSGASHGIDDPPARAGKAVTSAT